VVPGRIGNYSIGFASGWFKTRKAWGRQSCDAGFILSDHADWDGLNEAIKLTQAERVYVTHGFTAQFVKWLRSNEIKAFELNKSELNKSELNKNEMSL